MTTSYQSSERSTARSAFFTTLALLVGLSMYSYFSLLGSQAASAGSSRGSAAIQTPSPKPNFAQTVSGYYSLRRGLAATLMLSNQGPKDVSISCAIFSQSGERLDVPAFTLFGNTVQAIDIRKWLPQDEDRFVEGSIQVSFTGMDMIVGGLIKLVDAEHRLIFSTELMDMSMSMSARLEGVWSLPSRSAEFRLALVNTTSTRTEVTINLDIPARNDRGAKSVTLDAYETRVVDIGGLIEAA
jgi:hypothetical protein